jgi:hypothetical protein
MNFDVSSIVDERGDCGSTPDIVIPEKVAGLELNDGGRWMNPS